MTDLATWLLEQIADDEQVAREATPGPWADWEGSVHAPTHGKYGATVAGAAMSSEDVHDPMEHGDSAHIARWDPKRALAECDAKRKRVEWLLGLQHDMGTEDFPTYDSCRALLQPGELGDLDVGYCSCGLDTMRRQILRFEALPYADRPGYEEEWRP